MGNHTPSKYLLLKEKLEKIINSDKNVVVNIDLLFKNEIIPYFMTVFFDISENYPYKIIYIESKSEIVLRSIRKLMRKHLIQHDKRPSMINGKYIFAIHT